MRRGNNAFLYTVVNPEYYETLDHYIPDEKAFLRPIKALLPTGWDIERAGPWYTCTPPPPAIRPDQGWKIHISATLSNSASILTTAARRLIPTGTAFKFAADRFLLYILNSKRWQRGGSGKFITIYPGDIDVFKELTEKLYSVLVGHSGPYILSDRRYKDSSVVYYRYGGFSRMADLNVKGNARPMIRTPDGGWMPDERQAYYSPPQWVTDPFETSPSPPQESRTLRGGRYSLQGVLAFSNSGGVYLATDTATGDRVVIKEARPFTNLYLNGQDSVALLKKEHRLLSLLERTGMAPRPLDFFKEWEHYFLVEEFVEAQPLRTTATENNVVLRTRPSLDDVERFADYFRRTYSRVARVIQTVHSHNIVFTDISHNNILIRRSNQEPVLIDFEAAYERGIDEPTPMFTPGFASEQQRQGVVAKFEDDLYALGALMIAAITPMMAMNPLHPEAHERFLEMLAREYGLPANIRHVISGLMHPVPSRRPSLAEVIDRLSEAWHPTLPRPSAYEADSICSPFLVKRILAHILSTPTYTRKDRLFPGDPAVFSTNPLSVAYGACGVAYALKEMLGEVPREITDWILERERSAALYPPGLYVGLAGIAWTLLALRKRDEAKAAAAMAHEHRLASDSADVFYGLAGLGMAELKMFAESGEEVYLAWARETGEKILRLRCESESGCWWPYAGDVYYGLAHGASGVALFLLYLYLATNDDRFLSVGRMALEYDLNNARRSRDNALTWTMGGGSRTVTPYWRHGGAGVGMVTLRYHCVTGEPRYRTVLEDIAADSDRKYTIFPGRFFGLAGLGDFLLDMSACFPEATVYREMARKVASGITLFRVDRADGTAFPGEDLLRLSCDFGTGSAGICLFLHRLLNGGRSPYMVDELLPRAAAEALGSGSRCALGVPA